MGNLIIVLQMESWTDTKILRKSTMKRNWAILLKEHKTKPSPKSDLYGHLKRGRKSNCYFQIVSWLFKNPQGTHPVRMFPQSPRLWKRIWAQTETLNVKMRLSSAWAGERNAEDRKREASLWGFLIWGWNSGILGL